MRFNKLDLNLLVALDALLTERSVSRAAEKLFMSQSAMSNALSRLRAHFDDQLLVQVGRKMTLTPRAEVLADPVRDILVRVEATVATQPEFDPMHADREFNLLVSDYSLTVLMPHLLSLASQRSTTVRFKMVPQLDQPKRFLERGVADLLIIPDGFCSPDHPREVLYQEHFVCVVWRDCALFGAEISVDEYLNAGHVVVETMGPNASTFDSWFLQSYGVTRRAAISTFSFATAPRLIVGTPYIATVHERLAHQLAKELPLRILKSPIDMPVMQQMMQWHHHHSDDPGIKWLRQLLHQGRVQMDKS